jgi:hypothetical protein
MDGRDSEERNEGTHLSTQFANECAGDKGNPVLSKGSSDSRELDESLKSAERGSSDWRGNLQLKPIRGLRRPLGVRAEDMALIHTDRKRREPISGFRETGNAQRDHLDDDSDHWLTSVLSEERVTRMAAVRKEVIGRHCEVMVALDQLW